MRSFLSLGVNLGGREGAGDRFSTAAACRSLLAVSLLFDLALESKAHSSSCPSNVSTPEDDDLSGPGVGGQCKIGGANSALLAGAIWLCPFSGPGDRSSAVDADPTAESSNPALGRRAGPRERRAASLTIQKILA